MQSRPRFSSSRRAAFPAGRPAHSLTRRVRADSLPLLAAVSLVALSGCGGGSGGSGPRPLPPTPAPSTSASNSAITGTVGDIFGVPLVGASVTFQGKTATTIQNGVFALPPVTVPAGQSYINGTITATASVNGKTYTGQNTVEVLSGDALTPSVYVVVSDPVTQGTIAGTVRDSSGRPLAGARIFAGTLGNSGTGFTNLGSIIAFADANGNYTMPQLPADSYRVTASLAGYTNQTIGTVGVTAGQSANAAFTLTAASSGNPVPAVSDEQADTFTYPLTPTRAVASSSVSRGLSAVRDYLLAKRGHLHNSRVVTANNIVLHRHATRAAPAGTIVETVLQWNYQAQNNVFGYDILRSTGDNNNFESIATLRDPLGDYFSDLDGAITPDVTYYYNIVPLDTILFPQGDTGGVHFSNDLAVRPLQPITVTAPAPSATVSATPTISWNAVNRAAVYTVFVYDRFPDYSTNASPLNPVFTQSVRGATSLTYSGAALQRGHTYYLVVTASDEFVNNQNQTVNPDSALSAIQSFTVQ